MLTPVAATDEIFEVGEGPRTLVITTATIELTPEQRRASPHSGRLFTARVDVPGLPVTPVVSAQFPTESKAGTPCS